MPYGRITWLRSNLRTGIGHRRFPSRLVSRRSTDTRELRLIDTSFAICRTFGCPSSEFCRPSSDFHGPSAFGNIRSAERSRCPKVSSLKLSFCRALRHELSLAELRLLLVELALRKLSFFEPQVYLGKPLRPLAVARAMAAGGRQSVSTFCIMLSPS